MILPSAWRASSQLGDAAIATMPLFGEPVCDDHHKMIDIACSYGRRPSGRIRAACRPTATSRRASKQWLHSRRVGGGSWTWRKSTDLVEVWACYLQPPPSSDGSATSKTGVATNRNSAAESVADVADDGGMSWMTMPAKDQQNRAMLPMLRMLRTWRETGGECQHPLRQTAIRSTSPSLCVERLSFALNAASLPTANRCRPSPTTGDGRGCISAAKRPG
jgi:hypothetical protein